MSDSTYLQNADTEAIEELYHIFLNFPDKLDISWQRFFEGFQFGLQNESKKDTPVIPDEFKVLALINDYRARGHLFTATNPVRKRRQYTPSLDITNFGLDESQRTQSFNAGNELGLGYTTLQTIITHLQQTYCKSTGIEYMHMRDLTAQQWIREKIEPTRNEPQYDTHIKRRILTRLAEAVTFEKFIHKKFPGQKRFSLEGAEALIPALDMVTEKGALLGIQEFVIGMSHRGRLNVLAHILEKPYADIFNEFGGKLYDDFTILGDVKYHLGSTTERTTRNDLPIKLTLAPNPSHLEAVDPVVEGIVRARADEKYHGHFDAIAPILIHGDASIAGQGILYEIIQMSQLPGYTTGGTIHLIVNNQIGFTTNYLEGRSSTYCTDIAKIIQAPVFHVNGDDAEAVSHTVELAIEYRQKFHRDVFIDLLCYRKYGHNESDEPRFTQPILYKAIEKHPNPFEIYQQKLIEEGNISPGEHNAIAQRITNLLEKELMKAKKMASQTLSSFLGSTWENIRKAVDTDFEQSPNTAIPLEKLLYIGEKITSPPANKATFLKTTRLLKERHNMLFENRLLDWAMGELLAYGSLLTENIPVRLSGQDVARGTFSHRHAQITIEDSEEVYTPLNNINDSQATFEVYNSPLSEYGVLGFEYGYSLASPYTLTIWEAQFGDFSNGAQIIFDQFISSAEDKWNVMNDLVVLLPHGYEGQGPEHSSGRLERFLTLCAEHNIQIANPTTPANMFHLLRRQLHRSFRKPLIIFTPKSLLRHPQCRSPLNDFTDHGFLEVIDDPVAQSELVTRVAFCSGKVYYDLAQEQILIDNKDVALIRIEQLYPYPHQQIQRILQKYAHVNRWLWVQEEPANMGAWAYISQKLREVKLNLVARPASGSTATGSSEFHHLRQRKIIEKTFSECSCDRVKEECRMLCIGNDYTNYI